MACRRQESLRKKNGKRITTMTLDEVTLSEPNVLLLDYANYRLELGPEWPSLTEIRIIKNTVRKQLSLLLKLDNSSQLWTGPSSAGIFPADIYLRFTINPTIFYQ